MTLLPGRPPDALAVNAIRLRALQVGDWSMDYHLSRDPAVLAGTTFPPRLTEGEARRRVVRAVQGRAEGRCARWVIELDGDAVGIAGASARRDCGVEVYYALLPAGRGRGVATQAARLLAGWATGAGASRVVLVTFPENGASRSTAGRAGFVVVGRETRKGAEGDREVEVWEYDRNNRRVADARVGNRSGDGRCRF